MLHVVRGLTVLNMEKMPNVSSDPEFSHFKCSTDMYKQWDILLSTNH